MNAHTFVMVKGSTVRVYVCATRAGKGPNVTSLPTPVKTPPVTTGASALTASVSARRVLPAPTAELVSLGQVPSLYTITLTQPSSHTHSLQSCFVKRLSNFNFFSNFSFAHSRDFIYIFLCRNLVFIHYLNFVLENVCFYVFPSSCGIFFCCVDL